ncbi:2-keto-4-pentenoate hydratase [Arthrobacter mobilis]|uniref:4-oxalocrotonate decarboxylase n=1 Tax=Arthrobacter mobilis TaxID=2724944 RepID=A0A7X6HH63_9MICC|nr:fumarylacetoacetate hydrolase family protein [Arthrobacter mobilis]NKX55577.1 4-oxalocrotonate decarboxylase [Arthrobacter mobilis]
MTAANTIQPAGPDIAGAARELDRAEREATAIPQFGDTLSLEQAYAVQAELLTLRLARGERLTGAKLGFTSKAKMAQMGVSEVIVGFLTDRMHVAHGSSLLLEGFVHPRIEPEIAFRFNRTVEPGASAEEIISSVDAVAPALEIIDSRYRDFSFSLADVVADNTSASRYLVGEWTDFTTDLADRAVTMLIDGAVAETGTTSAILGDPLHALEAFTRMNARYGSGLPAGAVLLAGAATAAVGLQPGSTVSAVVAGIGTVELETKGMPA